MSAAHKALTASQTQALAELILQRVESSTATGSDPAARADALQDILATLTGAVCGTLAELRLRSAMRPGFAPAYACGPTLRHEAIQNAAAMRVARAEATARRSTHRLNGQRRPTAASRHIDHTHPQD